MGNPYLLAYNALVFCGWAYCLFLTIDTVLLKKGSTADLWQAVALPLKVSQTAAILEVVHSMIGLVRSPVMITGMQVASRLWIVWGIIVPVPETTGQSIQFAQLAKGLNFELSLTTLLLAWSITEVIRYSFFAFKELGSVPYPLLWLRYSSFIPLYPLGVASELAMVRLAYPTIYRTHMWSLDLPNAYNWGFDYAVACGLLVLAYMPGLPNLYLYMLAQRKKVLSGAGAKGGRSQQKAKAA